MGRKRSFDTEQVIARAGETFAVSGYHGTSVDDLLKATGIQRASLYQAFGSKRQLFVEALRHCATEDLLLVALMDLAAGDEEIRSLAVSLMRQRSDDPAVTLGRSLLARAGLENRDTEEKEQS